MAYRPTKPNPTSERDIFDLANASTLIAANGIEVPIVNQTRRRVTVECNGQRVDLKRRELIRDGRAAAADGKTFRISAGVAPDDT